MSTVLRWHANADDRLRNSGDTVKMHEIRVASLCMRLCAFLGMPLHASDLPRAALNHDEAESIVGDIPGPAKRRFPDLKEAYERAEAEVLAEMGIAPFNLNPDEAAVLKICDRLDAILWAMEHGVWGPDWEDDLHDLRNFALRFRPQALALVDMHVMCSGDQWFPEQLRAIEARQRWLQAEGR